MFHPDHVFASVLLYVISTFFSLHVLRFPLTVQYGYVYVPFIRHSNPSPSFHAHVIAIHPSHSCPSIVVAFPRSDLCNLLLAREHYVVAYARYIGKFHLH